jgi:hypothetical protein
MEELLKQFYPDIFVHLKEIEYNMTLNIEDYFGREVIMIKSGHGGAGYNVRLLRGYYTRDIKYPKKYLEIAKQEERSIPAMVSICETDGWAGEIFLLERVKNILDLIDEMMEKIDNRNDGFLRLKNLKYKLRSF